MILSVSQIHEYQISIFVNTSRVVFPATDDHRYLVELSCGAALAGVYSGVVQQLQDDGVVTGCGPVVVVVCGGNAITNKSLQDFQKQTTTD